MGNQSLYIYAWCSLYHTRPFENKGKPAQLKIRRTPSPSPEGKSKKVERKWQEDRKQMDKAKTQTATPEAGARVMTVQHKQVKPLIESQG